MKAALIALAVSVLFVIVGAGIYSSMMSKMAEEKNVNTNIKLEDVKSGKVKPPVEYAGGVAD